MQEPSKVNVIEFNLGKIHCENLNQSFQFRGRFIYPPKTNQNPNVNEAQQQNITWLIQMGLISPNYATKIESLKPAAAFASSLYNKPVSDLNLMTDFLCLLFLLDDIMDRNSSIIKIVNAEKVFETIVKILKGDYSKSNVPLIEFPLYEAFCHATFDIYARLIERGMDLTEFCKSINKYFAAVIWELKTRINKQPFSDITYLYMRKFTGAVKSVFELSFILNKIELPPEKRKNPIISRIILAANNIIGISNDIISFVKEINEKDHHNIIYTKFLEFKEQCNRTGQDESHLLQQAFDYAVDLHNKEVVAFLSFEQYLPKEDLLIQFYAILRDCFRDNLDWSVKETSRYQMQKLQYKEYEYNRIEKFTDPNNSESAFIKATPSSKPPQSLLFTQLKHQSPQHLLQQWVQSVAAQGTWTVERDSRTLRIVFQPKNNVKDYCVILRQFQHHLSQLPEWQNVAAYQQEDNALLIRCQNEIDTKNYEEPLKGILRIEEFKFDEICVIS